MTTTAEGGTLLLHPHFNGPPSTANGGYACGLIAEQAALLLGPGPITVALHRPPPLETELRLRRRRNRLQVCSTDHDLIATARLADEVCPPADAVGLSQAEEAATRFPGQSNHPAPTCFVCGTSRKPGSGLHISPGPLADGSGRFACPWTVPAASAGDGGTVPQQFIWAALDCAAAWTIDQQRALVPLAQMTVRNARTIRATAELVIVARLEEFDGTFGSAVSTLFDLSGREIATASTVWIRPEAARMTRQTVPP